ncbi:hypothetical protein [Actinobacillus pleuropneumoniae]|uniref:hypothetical protein n=1 Tax=Actinobacillus pleuropneumoniae TaxID=715 RepID=UPI001F30B9A8|nr:hypothetical protein [Actinobacillus pleuropneumoniae]UKH19914.1 hypothetical protein D1109_01560 [Actinobacillus pleuropneumoniae]UPA21988.1 hypothetical protein JS559_04530 [Actinobacillus pleuropneumoniae]
MAIDDWNLYPQKRPIKSGNYLVVVTVKNESLGINRLVTLSNYDAMKHEFDFDARMKERESAERVYAWVHYKEPPPPPTLKTPKGKKYEC